MLTVGTVGCRRLAAKYCRSLCIQGIAAHVGHADGPLPSKDEYSLPGKLYAAPEELFEKAKPEAVFILVPPSERGDIEASAVQRRLHIFLHKPVGLTPKQVTGLQETMKRAKTMVAVGYHYRYSDLVERARQFLRGKPPCVVSAEYFVGIPEDGWVRERAVSGGLLFQHMTHVFDLMRYLCGEIAEVYALETHGCMHKVPNYTWEDGASVSLLFKNKAVGSFVASCAAQHAPSSHLTMVLPDVTLRLDREKLIVREADKEMLFRSRRNAFDTCVHSFVKSIESGDTRYVRSSFADAVKTFSVCFAAAESVRTGTAVRPSLPKVADKA